MEFNQKPGWIELICGPMFAGKSEELIRRSKRMDYAHQKYICFKPEIDNRYSESEIVSHAKNRTKSININHSSEIEQYLSDDVKTVIIDEIQFLDEGIVDVCSSLAKRGKRVIVAGLDMDFRGVPFKNTALLLAISEYVTKLTSICVKCGAPATMTQRVINGVPVNYDDPIIVVGASESYEPRCRHCHEVKYKK